MPKHEQKPLEVKEVPGISAKTLEIHHGKLYAGYVNKRNEIEEKLKAVDFSTANQIYSDVRGLKHEETFAANGQILHEYYFAVLGGDGQPTGKIKDAIETRWGSWGKFTTEFTATGMAARGWAILAFDWSDRELHIYAADQQNQGGVWGCQPLLCMDVYEHSYFIDHGSDRKAYIQAFLAAVDWDKVNQWFEHISG